MEPMVTTTLPTRHGAFELTAYDSGKPEQPHLFLKSGAPCEVPLVRIHSECWTGDVVGSLKCDCGPQLESSLEQIAAHGGAVIYLRQEGRGIGLVEKMKAYNLQAQGMDTYEANEALGHQSDYRRFDEAVAMLRAHGWTTIKLMTNNPEKLDALQESGIDVVEVHPIMVDSVPENQAYMEAKRNKAGHGLLTPKKR